jgi:hypothetical protein
VNRSTALCVPLATLALSVAAEAAEPGFYLGAPRLAEARELFPKIDGGVHRRSMDPTIGIAKRQSLT